MHNQIKGFFNTPSLFQDDFYGLKVFDLEYVALNLDDFDIENIKIVKQLPLGKRVEFFLKQ